MLQSEKAHPLRLSLQPHTALHSAVIYIREHKNRTGNGLLLVVPICLWGDATHIDTAGLFKLEPWSFSPLIFKEKLCRNNQFWVCLLY